MEKYHYYNIPAKLAENKKHTRAILYGCIKTLSVKKGYCWASNKYLAEKIGLKNPGHISKCIQELKKDGWIKINGSPRKIWPIDNNSEKTTTPIRNNECSPSEIPEDSNINSNIKSNINNIRKLDHMKKGFMDNSKFP